MEINQIQLISLDDVLNYTSFNGAIDDSKIGPHIRNSQNLYLEPLLGSDLYNKICDMVEDGSISGSTNYDTLYSIYIIPTLCFYTIEQYVPFNAFNISDLGIGQYQAANTNVSPMNEIDKLVQKYKVLSDMYSKRLNEYLTKNYTLFPELNNTGLVKKVEPTQRMSGIYLGDNYNDNKIRY